MADVFISYHEKSAGEIVREIAAALEDVGVSCWYAERDLTAPGSFAATITQEIRACKVFLLVLDEGSNQSEHVKSEVHLAFQRIANHEAIAMKCFKVDNCTLSNHMAYYLASVQRTNGNPTEAEHMQLLAEQIAGILHGLPTWKMIQERNQQIQALEQAQDNAQKRIDLLLEYRDKLQTIVRLLSRQLSENNNALSTAREQIQALKQQIEALEQERVQHIQKLKDIGEEMRQEIQAFENSNLHK